MEQLLTRIVLRNDTTANWLANSSQVLLKGEPAFEFQEDGQVKMKIGDGVSTWEELGYFAGGEAYTIEELQAAVKKLENSVGQIEETLTPTDGVPLLTRLEALESQFTGTGEGSIDEKINAKINEFATRISEDGTVNTIKELIDYVAEHGAEFADMAAHVQTLQELVGNTPVSQQIMDAINGTGHIAEDKATALFENVKYEVTSKPAGALVDYRDKEIRVMCPADTQWVHQQVGANGNANMYYMGFKAYAPAGAVSFKEDDSEIIADQTMYYFENNDFAGVDKYGRKYSIVWLALASYDEATQTWTYFGAKSSKERYIGWYYSVEWYDENGAMIESDMIRINLSNEECHKNIEPYYMSNVVKEISVNGVAVEKEDGRVNIGADDVVKSTEEILVNEDGTLEVGMISLSKIGTDDGTVLVLNGGNAN